MQEFNEKLGTAKFEACCKLYAVFKELTGQFGRLTEPSWTVHIQDAGHRSVKIIESEAGFQMALSFCKAHAHKVCLQKLNAVNAIGPLPVAFTKFKQVVEAFEALSAIEGEPVPSDDHTEVSKHLANLVTFLSLDVKVVMALYPERHAKVDAYQSQVVGNVLRTLNKMKAEIREAQKALDTFRQGVSWAEVWEKTFQLQ